MAIEKQTGHKNIGEQAATIATTTYTVFWGGLLRHGIDAAYVMLLSEATCVSRNGLFLFLPLFLHILEATVTVLVAAPVMATYAYTGLHF